MLLKTIRHMGRHGRSLSHLVEPCQLSLTHHITAHKSVSNNLCNKRPLHLSSPLQKVVRTAYDHESFAPKRKSFKESILPIDWHKLVDKYPDFLPDPNNRSPLLIHRDIDDMLERRKAIEIPEFYVGSILAVTVTDKYSETKRTRFVGICIHRTGQLKRANFTLRNIIDGMGVEIRYDLYNPLLLSIEVLKLEKRLDDQLWYLRDAPPEYSTVPEDMKPVELEEGAEVPINPLRINLNPQPWSRRWERWLLKGVKQLDDIPEYFAEKIKRMEEDPVYSYDLMLEYRRHCTEELMYGICRKLAEHERTVVDVRRQQKARRFMQITKRQRRLVTDEEKKDESPVVPESSDKSSPDSETTSKA